MNQRIGFIGLGALGLPMAANLIERGYALDVYNRTASKAEPLAEKGAHVVERAVDVVVPGGIVVSLLWNSDVVEEVISRDGFLDKLGEGGIHIVMCTGSPDAAKRLAQRHVKHGCAYVEAPIFGRPEAAQVRQLSIPMAGPQAAKQRARPILEAMGAQGIFDFGEKIGAATVVKLVGNFLLISASRSMNESLTMAREFGVDVQAIVDMLTRSLFPGPIYSGYGGRLARNETSLSQPDIPLKDLGLFEATAQHMGVSTPTASLLQQLLKNAAAGRSDAHVRETIVWPCQQSIM